MSCALSFRFFGPVVGGVLAPLLVAIACTTNNTFGKVTETSSEGTGMGSTSNDGSATGSTASGSAPDSETTGSSEGVGDGPTSDGETTGSGTVGDGSGSDAVCDFEGTLASLGEGKTDPIDCGTAREGDGAAAYQAVHDCVVEAYGNQTAFFGAFEVDHVKATGVYVGFFGLSGVVYGSGRLDLDPTADFPGSTEPVMWATYCPLAFLEPCTPSPNWQQCIECGASPDNTIEYDCSAP